RKELQRTRRSGATAPDYRRANRRRHRVGIKLWHFRSRLGNADSVTGPDFVARARRRKEGADLERGEEAVPADDPGRDDTELRPSQPRRRRRRTIAQTDRGTTGRAGEAVIGGTGAVPSLFAGA